MQIYLFISTGICELAHRGRVNSRLREECIKKSNGFKLKSAQGPWRPMGPRICYHSSEQYHNPNGKKPQNPGVGGSKWKKLLQTFRLSVRQSSAPPELLETKRIGPSGFSFCVAFTTCTQRRSTAELGSEKNPTSPKLIHIDLQWFCCTDTTLNFLFLAY